MSDLIPSITLERPWLLLLVVLLPLWLLLALFWKRLIGSFLSSPQDPLAAIIDPVLRFDLTLKAATSPSPKHSLTRTKWILALSFSLAILALSKPVYTSPNAPTSQPLPIYALVQLYSSPDTHQGQGGGESWPFDAVQDQLTNYLSHGQRPLGLSFYTDQLFELFPPLASPEEGLGYVMAIRRGLELENLPTADQSRLDEALEKMAQNSLQSPYPESLSIWILASTLSSTELAGLDHLKRKLQAEGVRLQIGLSWLGPKPPSPSALSSLARLDAHLLAPFSFPSDAPQSAPSAFSQSFDKAFNEHLNGPITQTHPLSPWLWWLQLPFVLLLLRWIAIRIPRTKLFSAWLLLGLISLSLIKPLSAHAEDITSAQPQPKPESWSTPQSAPQAPPAASILSWPGLRFKLSQVGCTLLGSCERKYIQKGIELYRQADYKGAIIWFQEASGAYGLYNLGGTFAHLGKLSLALKSYQGAAEAAKLLATTPEVLKLRKSIAQNQALIQAVLLGFPKRAPKAPEEETTAPYEALQSRYEGNLSLLIRRRMASALQSRSLEEPLPKKVRP